MAYVKADLDQLQGYEGELQAFLESTAANYQAFYRAASHLIWEDVILERVTETMNKTITHLNAIRGAIAGNKRALRQMEDALERYCEITFRK